MIKKAVETKAKVTAGLIGAGAIGIGALYLYAKSKTTAPVTPGTPSEKPGTPTVPPEAPAPTVPPVINTETIESISTTAAGEVALQIADLQAQIAEATNNFTATAQSIATLQSQIPAAEHDLNASRGYWESMQTQIDRDYGGAEAAAKADYERWYEVWKNAYMDLQAKQDAKAAADLALTNYNASFQWDPLAYVGFGKLQTLTHNRDSANDAYNTAVNNEADARTTRDNYYTIWQQKKAEYDNATANNENQKADALAPLQQHLAALQNDLNTYRIAYNTASELLNGLRQELAGKQAQLAAMGA